jgi:hypothetical protein
MPWMVYTVVFLVANTVVYIVSAAEYFAVGYAVNGVAYIIGVIIYICK